MNTRRPSARITLALSALALLVTGGLLLAGPLDPPAGPITSTYKTLSEVEPRTAVNAANTPGDADSLFKITQRGSYYLTGSIAGVVGKHGIEIAASGVTLDLNGFDLVGAAGMGAFDGAAVTVANLVNIAVVNGSVRNWGGDGVDLGTASVFSGRVANVTASFNLGNGISIARTGTVLDCSASWNTGRGINGSEACTITGCSTYRNSGDGIFAGAIATVSDCSAHSNLGRGIVATMSGTVSNCSASFNTLSGFDLGTGSAATNCSALDNNGSGIVSGNGSTLVNCSTQANTLNGILTGTACTVTGCSALSNAAQGIIAGAGSTVTTSSVQSNTSHGISLTGGGTITGCTVFSNTGVGIVGGDGAKVIGCSVKSNTSTGITIGVNSAVADCNVRTNGNGGILCATRCNIRNNECADNLVDAGIHATGSYNCITGNNLANSGLHLLVDAPSNIITKNTFARVGSGVSVVAGNVILLIDAVHAAAVSGYVGGIGPGSTDPNANLMY